ncbi:MAG: DUF2550 domain-containing protein, partial [Actinomycetes bacterium]
MGRLVPVLDGVLVLVVVIIVLLLLAAVSLVARRRVIMRAGGTFECSLRSGGRTGGGRTTVTARAYGKGWTLGLARYGGNSLEWFRVFSWSLRPRHVFPRGDLLVRGRRKPAGPEALSLLAGSVVIECAVGRDVVELALSEDALTGLLSWLESAPPGQNVSV